MKNGAAKIFSTHRSWGLLECMKLPVVIQAAQWNVCFGNIQSWHFSWLQKWLMSLEDEIKKFSGAFSLLELLAILDKTTHWIIHTLNRWCWEMSLYSMRERCSNWQPTCCHCTGCSKKNTSKFSKMISLTSLRTYLSFRSSMQQVVVKCPVFILSSRREMSYIHLVESKNQLSVDLE